MNFRVILASLAISSARVMYNPMTKGTESVFHLINSASDPAPAWNVNSANAGFLTPRDVITTANPIVYALSPAGHVATAPPATVHHANGAIVPADTPQVKAAKAAFRQAGGVVSAATPGVSKEPPAIVSHANDAKTPADTPAVQAAKASHNMKVQAAKSAFRQAGGNLIPTGDTAPAVYARALGAGVSQGPPATVHHANGAIVPADTPQVKAAKAAFRQAGGVISAATSGMSQGPPAIVSYANGAKTPADTPEVQAAMTSHNMKVQAAKSAFRHAGGNLVPTGDAFIASVATPVSYVHAPTTLTQSPVVFARPLFTSAHSHEGIVSGHVAGATAVHPLALVA